MSRARTIRSIAVVLGILAGSGCAASRPDARWGDDVDLTPGWTAVRSAARETAEEPETWLPPLLGLLLQVDDWDGRVSDWARRETPVYGSTVRALDASDALVEVARGTWAVSVLLAPDGDLGVDWAWAKAKGAGLQLGAIATTFTATSTLKNATQRRRPDGSNARSFPSGHASHTGVCAALAHRNAATVLGPGGRPVSRAVTDGTALATGWARVEGGKHFPSDVLIGFAIGHFLGGFVDRAFRTLPSGWRITVEPNGLGVTIDVP
ncbi:MAG: phosphatase PAP2 family protein [Candidatus Eisenbacteria bacterium]|uniref:Phosphatase PAP2 family protein n=1 Tax=Eiseniibacteriota bacterium TaxID=2212470 RepID=A0A956RPS9_UNCEI|nr:phosphatase PAP2 family protein [Candidatus Eisenbacteria bacterium]